MDSPEPPPIGNRFGGEDYFPTPELSYFIIDCDMKMVYFSLPMRETYNENASQWSTTTFPRASVCED